MTTRVFNPRSPGTAAAGRALLDELHLLGTTFDSDDRYVLPDWLVSACKRIGPVERATVKIATVARRADVELPLLLESAALRLAIYEANGSLARMSGNELARTLQELYGPTAGSALRRSAYGWGLLATLDGLDLINVAVSTLVGGDYRPARLHAVVQSPLDNH